MIHTRQSKLMKISSLYICILSAISSSQRKTTTSAFTLPTLVIQTPSKPVTPSWTLFATEEAKSQGNNNNNDDDKEPVIHKAPTEPGSHSELMYALGVNLARQLGDIRPLVENGEELTLVAKGLLDTVIGRLSEEGQVTLLQSRRNDLNSMITERA
jgi:hypothetical protein